MFLDRWRFHTMVDEQLVPYVFEVDREEHENKVIALAQNHGPGHSTHERFHCPDDDML